MVLALDEDEDGFCRLWRRLRGEDCSAEKERCGMTMFAGRSFRRLRGGDDVFAGEAEGSSDGGVSDGCGRSMVLIWNMFSFSGAGSLSQLMIWLKKPSMPMDSRFSALPRGREYFE